MKIFFGYLARLSKKLDAKDGTLQQIGVYSCKCCVWFFDEIVEYVTNNSFIQLAVDS